MGASPVPGTALSLPESILMPAISLALAATFLVKQLTRKTDHWNRDLELRDALVLRCRGLGS